MLRPKLVLGSSWVHVGPMLDVWRPLLETTVAWVGKQLLEVFDFGCTIACVLASSHDILMHVGSEAAFVAVWETCTEYHCTPTKVFLKFSQSLRRPPTVATWLKITEPNLE